MQENRISVKMQILVGKISTVLQFSFLEKSIFYFRDISLKTCEIVYRGNSH